MLMIEWAKWLGNNWLIIVIPLLVFMATSIVGWWLRRLAYNAYHRWEIRVRFRGSHLVARPTYRLFLFWVLLLGVCIAIQVSVLPVAAKGMTNKAVGSLFILSLSWLLITLSEILLKLYLHRLKTAQATNALIINTIRIAIILIGLVIVFDIWVLPISPILILIAVVILVVMLAFRNVIPNLLAGFQLGNSQQIKEGDYIKLENGDEGYITAMDWNSTHIRAANGSIVSIPNSQLLQQKVVNYGYPLKKAKEPFRFFSHTHLTELTGLKAKNLHELVDIMKTVPDTVIYYHTHHFLEEHHYLTPEPSNDFAVWVNNVLGDEALGERLASVDTFAFSTLAALRERFVGVIEEYLAGVSNLREAMPGREFYFVKSISVLLPTPYVAGDLREFIEALRKISLSSLYLHIFESRLRLGRGLNDFSIWLQNSLDEDDLGKEIARLDPYTYTLEGLRSTLIQLIEKRIE